MAEFFPYAPKTTPLEQFISHQLHLIAALNWMPPCMRKQIIAEIKFADNYPLLLFYNYYPDMN